MAGWREKATAVLKEALQGATEPKEIREISNALSSLQPYESEGATAQPMPVRIVGKPKARRKGKRWVPPSKRGK